MLEPDTEGLHAIANTDRADRVADIVFVHGLAGKSHATWRYGSAGDDDHFFWPGELGREFPECGIWSLGYEAGMVPWFGTDGLPIEDRAINLAHKLTTRGIGDRPVIFITHSMGGLMVKEIVVQAQTAGDVDWSRLVAQIKGVVFCGTPHRGSDVALMAKRLTVILRTQQHIREMSRGERHLDRLHSRFVEWHRVSGVRAEAYTEGKGFKRSHWWARWLPPVFIVRPESANPQLAGCRSVPCSRDHLELVKPPSYEDDVYAGVSKFVLETLGLPRRSPPSRRVSNSVGDPAPLAADAANGTENGHLWMMWGLGLLALAWQLKAILAIQKIEVTQLPLFGLAYPSHVLILSLVFLFVVLGPLHVLLHRFQQGKLSMPGLPWFPIKSTFEPNRYFGARIAAFLLLAVGPTAVQVFFVGRFFDRSHIRIVFKGHRETFHRGFEMLGPIREPDGTVAAFWDTNWAWEYWYDAEAYIRARGWDEKLLTPEQKEQARTAAAMQAIPYIQPWVFLLEGILFGVSMIWLIGRGVRIQWSLRRRPASPRLPPPGPGPLDPPVVGEPVFSDFLQERHVLARKFVADCLDQVKDRNQWNSASPTTKFMSKVGVSYSWQEEKSGPNAGNVNAFCENLGKRGLEIVRDVDRVRHGDSLKEFMRNLGASDFLCVFLSPGYLGSPNCMYELLVSWERSKDNPEEFKNRVKVWAMSETPDLRDPAVRLGLASKWKAKADELGTLIQEAGAMASGATQDERRRILEFSLHTDAILQFIADRLSPGSLEAFQTWIASHFPTLNDDEDDFEEPDEATLAQTYVKICTEIDSRLSQHEILRSFLREKCPALVDPTSGRLSDRYRSRDEDICTALKGIKDGVESYRGTTQAEWQALSEVVGGLVALGVNRRWVERQRQKVGCASVPGNHAAFPFQRDQSADLLPVIAATLANGYVRLERVFGAPNPMSLAVPPPAVPAGVLDPDRMVELKLHFIDYILGPTAKFDRTKPAEIAAAFENTRDALKYAATEENDPFFTSNPDYWEIIPLIRSLELDHLFLILPSGKGNVRDVITDPVFLFSHALKIWQAISPKLKNG